MPAKTEREEMFVRKDERTGDVILSRKPGWSTWNEYFECRDTANPARQEFMAGRRLNGPITDSAIFGDEEVSDPSCCKLILRVSDTGQLLPPERQALVSKSADAEFADFDMDQSRRSMAVRFGTGVGGRVIRSAHPKN